MEHFNDFMKHFELGHICGILYLYVFQGSMAINSYTFAWF